MYGTKHFKIVKVLITGALFLLTITFGTIAKCATFFVVVHLNPMIFNSNNCSKLDDVPEEPLTNDFDQNNLTSWIW
jgi:hypothetical protein